MNFMEAVESMQKGERLIRKTWETGFSITILPNQTFIWSIADGGKNPTINASIYIPKIEDIFSEDWQVKTKIK